MTVHAFVRCDEPGCRAQVEGMVAPESWMAIVAGPSTSQFGLPQTRHFCPSHLDSAAATRALQAMRGRRDAVEGTVEE